MIDDLCTLFMFSVVRRRFFRFGGVGLDSCQSGLGIALGIGLESSLLSVSASGHTGIFGGFRVPRSLAASGWSGLGISIGIGLGVALLSG